MTTLKANHITFPHIRPDICLYAPHFRSVPSEWTCGKHLHHMMFEFLLVLEGRLTAFHGNVEQELKAGDLVLISPMHLHGYEVIQTEGASFFDGHIIIEDEVLLHLFETENLAFYSKSHPLNEALQPWIKELMEVLQDSPLRPTKVMLDVLHIIEAIHSYFKEKATKKGPAQQREPAYLIAKEIEKLMRKPTLTTLIEETPASFSEAEEGSGLGSNWLEEISRQLNISSRHCHRLFRQAYGMSPRQYLMILKQQEAMQLLASSNETIENIAYRLGYVNVQSFSRQFAAWVGCTPGGFRKNTPETINYLMSLPQSK
ncbi:helix-turn-helix domain-containing protein [Paenibacillus wynnii]|uniref:helix-turn-helix domain-containing protein n=1 Tax=Paenibacillus wynnii TaxID=268407 RepID=UPI0012FA6022|nr:AraC family transcriptional regulator [Paenibacillus wynnii]